MSFYLDNTFNAILFKVEFGVVLSIALALIVVVYHNRNTDPIIAEKLDLDAAKVSVNF